MFSTIAIDGGEGSGGGGGGGGGECKRRREKREWFVFFEKLKKGSLLLGDWNTKENGDTINRL